MQPDEQLVTLALAGSTDAADDLVRRHWPACWRVAYGIVVSVDDADEVAQEAFARAFASLETCRDRARFPQWLHRIAANSALDRLRARRPAVEYDDDVQIATAPVATELGDVVVEALAALPPGATGRARAAVLVRLHEEIAQLLDVPAGTVGSRVGRGLEDLRRILEVSDVDRG